MSDSVSAKIRKLMALASGSANANEAAAAAAMAAELALKHNIDLAVAAETRPKNFIAGEEAATSATNRDKAAQIILSGGLANLYGCGVLLETDRSRHWIYFTGQRHNIDMCNSWMRYLWRACERANASYNKGLSFEPEYDWFDDPRNTRRRIKYNNDSSFRRHFCSTVHDRLREKKEAMERHGASDGASTSNALAVVSWYEQERVAVREWMEKHYGHWRTTSIRKHNHEYEDRDAAIAGHRAGERVSLADQIAPQPTLKAIK